MARRPSAVHAELRADARARDAILREALSRLLRNATDPDIEARTLLSVIERRLGGGGPEMGVARQIIEEAIREDTRKRISALGTDGSP